MFKFIFNLLFLISFKNSAGLLNNKTECKGGNMGSSYVGDSQIRYKIYRTMYENCTHVDGNLELVFLDDPNFDLNFLSSIREINGYLLIVGNYVKELPLYSLRIIRGRTLFKQLYSIYIKYNYDENRPTGLRILNLFSLQEITAGSIHIQENKYLCHIDTINWNEMFMSETSFANVSKAQNCDDCHDSCIFGSKKHCWGSEFNMCQKFTKLGCDPRCDSRCFGITKDECCDSECSSGCDGPRNNQCWACKNFENGEQCVEFCPSEYLYNLSSFSIIPSKFKYSYGYQCVDKCPEFMFVDKGDCVSSCSDNKMPDKNGICISCEGICPKRCRVDIGSGFLNAKIIHDYKDCTILQGAIKILDSTFNGIENMDIPKMRVHKLQLLETIEEVTDFVQIQAENFRLKSLSFLKNLKIIHGQKLDRSQASLQISGTRLKSIDLDSLKQIKHGNVFILKNKFLCYANTINWTKIAPTSKILIQENKNESECLLEYEVCSSECSADGCWGGEEHQCLSCKNARLGTACISSCKSKPLLFKGETPDVCYKCHPQCKDSCSGPNSDTCENCLYSKDGNNCVEKCPLGKFSDYNNICQPCHNYCNPKYGCSGPLNLVGQNGCKSCIFGQSYDGINIDKCLDPETICFEGFYTESVFDDYIDKNKIPTCIKCHNSCRTCNGLGADKCTLCQSFNESSRCVDHCSSTHYHLNDDPTCHRCHNECLSCFGPTDMNCNICLHYKLYEMDNNNIFKCVPVCPDDFPQLQLIKTSTISELVCSRKGIDVKLLIFLSLIIIFIFIAILIYVICRFRRDFKDKLPQIENISQAELQKLNPSNQEPDMAKLNLIQDCDVKQIKIIGKGAFGVVYEGLWNKNNEDKKVAIKVLLNGKGSSSVRFLEEAHIMATVHHEYCMSILAVCCSNNLMLITELLPLGSLHDYLKQHQNEIGAITMSIWSYQISQGMAYLEKRAIVHRDLATRNILLKSHGHVMITDFGLALIRDHCSDLNANIKNESTMMPIKWLAYECIVDQTFTSKSDVWSYGVTLWEIFMFGARPYEDVKIGDMVQVLQSGFRLFQPKVAKTSLYNIMLDCWSLKPDDRPTFYQLVDIMRTVNIFPQEYILLPLYMKESVSSFDEGYRSEQERLHSEASSNIEVHTDDNSYKNIMIISENKYYNSFNDVFQESDDINI